MRKTTLIAAAIVVASNAFATSNTHSLKLRYNDNYEGSATVGATDKEKVESFEIALGKSKSSYSVKHQSEFTPCQSLNNGAMSSKESLVILKLSSGAKHEDLIKDAGSNSLDRKSLVISYAVYYAGEGCTGTPTFRSVTPMTLSLNHNLSDQQ